MRILSTAGSLAGLGALALAGCSTAPKSSQLVQPHAEQSPQSAEAPHIRSQPAELRPSSAIGFPVATANASRISQHDVINWSARGTREEVIIDRIAGSGTVFHLTARDENYLRDNGVSEAVIESMRATCRR